MAKTTKKRAVLGLMPKGISLYRQKSGKDASGKRKLGFTVRVGKKFSGKAATLKFVSNRVEAQEYIDSLKPHAETIKTSQLTPQQVSETILCLRHLEEKKSTLTLLQAVELGLKHHTPGSQKTIGSIADEIVKSAKARNARQSSVTQLQSALDIICDTFQKRPVASITSAEIQNWLDSAKPDIRERRRAHKSQNPKSTPTGAPSPATIIWSPRTKNNYLKQFSQLYTFAKRKGYCAVDPCESLDPSIITRKPPGILTPAQVKTLLDAAREKKPLLLRFIALGAFGWIRREEICGLTNADFRSDGMIQITTDNSKTRELRYIPVNDTLKAWLAIAPKSDAPTPSKNDDVMGEWVRNLAASVGIKIPHNAFRHSSISYAVAAAPTREGKRMINTVGEVAKYSGNSENIIYSNYRQLVTEQAGIEYWELRP
jgi:integrase